MLFTDRRPQSIFVLDNAKIYHLAELIKMCLDVNILLVYLLPYSCKYNPIKILFTILKCYIKKNGVLINKYIEEKTFELFLRCII